MDDVPVARRIADRVALSFARERGNVLSKQADEAEARAARLEARVRALSDELDSRTGYRRVVGESVPWRQVLTQATQVSATETTVLLLGESGTGKEVIARFLHRASSRKNGPFVALNCAALPEQLLEAELFGYERGAYTGATQSKPGQLEQASGGTLFLDEVGEMSPSAQAKFLRVLQEREFQRLGGTRVLRTDARIVAATNRDLPRAIAHGPVPRGSLLSPQRLRRSACRRCAIAAPMIVPAQRSVHRGDRPRPRRPPAGISRDARDDADGLSLARQRARTAQHPRARGDSVRWRPDHGRPSRDHRCAARAGASAHDGFRERGRGRIRNARDDRGDNAGRGGSHAGAAGRSAGLAAARGHAGAGAGAGAGPSMLSGGTPAQTSPPIAPAPRDQVAAMPASAGDLQSLEREMIGQALQRARFNKSKAAKALGLTRQQSYLRMRKYQLE